MGRRVFVVEGARDAAGLDLMVVDNLDLISISVFPAEANAIPLIDTNTCLPLTIALQQFQPITRWGL